MDASSAFDQERPDPGRSVWYSLGATRKDWYRSMSGMTKHLDSRGLGRGARTEMLYGKAPAPDRTKATAAPTWTDNRANGLPLDNKMTTTYPASWNSQCSRRR